MIGYVRVSTADQVESGLGLAAQETAIREEAERRGWDLEIVRDEGRSGKRVNPGLRSALDDLRAGLADGLVVAKLDRLARSVVHAFGCREPRSCLATCRYSCISPPRRSRRSSRTVAPGGGGVGPAGARPSTLES
jgi:hypothetical protein